MNEREEEIYNRLRTSIAVDPMQLEQQLIEMPQLVTEAAEWTAKAMNRRDKAVNDHKIACAEVADELRQQINPKTGKPYSEAGINSLLNTDAQVVRALTVAEDTKLDAALWMAVMEGLRSKSSAVDTIARLMQAGFVTPNAIYENRREELAEQRDARRRERAPR